MTDLYVGRDKREFLREAHTDKPEEEVLSHGILSLDIDDKDLVRVLNMKQREAESFYDSINLTNRRIDMNDYWKGKQIDRNMLYSWQVPYIDNVIYRDVETILPIAVSKIPDVIVGTPIEDPEKKKRAENLQKVLDFRVKGRYIRSVLRSSLRHLLLNLVGIIKCRWDRDKQTFIFEPVRPSHVILDHTATPNYFGMSNEPFEFIAEWIEEPLKVVVAKFPNKKSELFDRIDGGPIKLGTERQMASKIRYQEIWFTWYDNEGKPLEGVCWKYKDVILDKMRNPYWDIEGREEVVGENPLTGDNVKKTRFFNHFSKPMKPYIILNFQNTGSSGPIDDTTPVEQVIPLQDVINKRGRQITELADKANPKKIFSNDFISKEDAANVTDDPQESIVGNGDIRAGFSHVPGVPPNPTLFQDLIQNRLEIDNILGAHATTRGERVPEESGIARQITREGDFGRIDDLVFQVVEQAGDEIANWMVQFMKVFGTREHFEQVLGVDGQSEFVQFDRDTIDDGLNITVTASTVNKTETRSTATQLASSGAIDPMSLFEDLGAKNPKERARRLVAFNASPQAYMDIIIGDKQASETLLNLAAVGEPGSQQGGGGPPPQTPQGITPAVVAPPVEEGNL